MPFGYLASWQLPAQLLLLGGSVRVPGTALSVAATASLDGLRLWSCLTCLRFSGSALGYICSVCWRGGWSEKLVEA